MPESASTPRSYPVGDEGSCRVQHYVSPTCSRTRPTKAISGQKGCLRPSLMRPSNRVSCRLRSRRSRRAPAIRPGKLSCAIRYIPAAAEMRGAAPPPRSMPGRRGIFKRFWQSAGCGTGGRGGRGFALLAAIGARRAALHQRAFPRQCVGDDH